ncbi:MAG TPA: DUF167 family protein [Gammaproteobacteria bacterium]|nr:DUF167 family protein [Gammaproteobacteria bacterium]
MTAGWYTWHDGDLVLRLRVVPRAAADVIMGPYGDRLRVRLAAPPVEGRANEHLCAWLAECCGVPRRDVTLVAGFTGRDKTVRIHRPRRLPDGVAPPPAETLRYS